jgi:DNA (cytosine-5)-methyltransferase 1
MSKPRLLDLFCGAGGAAMGYHRAGFEVVGVDIADQPRYPFEFHRDDALSVLDDTMLVGTFDAIHASPPCQAHSTIAKQARLRFPGRFDHPDLVAPARASLEASGLPWVMENVKGAPFVTWFQLCGSSFGLDVRRHRIFETGAGFNPLLVPRCAHQWQRPRFRSLDKRHPGLSAVVGVHGHLNYAGERVLREQAMGIDWMSDHELAEAIPPAYTEWIGTQLLAALEHAA